MLTVLGQNYLLSDPNTASKKHTPIN